ncbi:unnamed protein product, partial [Sphenostylis stenocarpa]
MQDLKFNPQTLPLFAFSFNLVEVYIAIIRFTGKKGTHGHGLQTNKEKAWKRNVDFLGKRTREPEYRPTCRTARARQLLL